VHRVLAPVRHTVVVQDDSDRAIAADVVCHPLWGLGI
jgi:hypothetical protein